MVRNLVLKTCVTIGVAQASQMVCTTPQQDLCSDTVANNNTNSDTDGGSSLHSSSLLALAMGIAGAKMCGDSPVAMPLALVSLAVGADGAPRRLGSGGSGGGGAGAVSVVKTAPTCSTAKAAYTAAGCCDAADKTTREVAEVSPIYRPGCKSQIATAKSSGPIVGGSLYVFDTSSSDKKWKTFSDGKNYVDLAESSVNAGCTPKHKPHMVRPSPNNKFVILTYTGDQDFAVLQSDEYKVVGCPTVDFLKTAKQTIFGGATHDGAWYTDNHFLFLDMTGCIDGTCGGGIYRFNFTYSAGKMTKAEFDRALSVEGVKEARGTSGTKPISLASNKLGAYSDLYFVTDAKGAGSIMDAKSMTWVKHFSKSEFGDCSAGGLWVEPHPTDAEIVIAQYGKQGTADAPGYSCLFTVNMRLKTMTLLKKLRNNVDAHGLQFCTTTGNALTLINSNRQDATIDVISYPSGDYAQEAYQLNTVFDTVAAEFKKDPNAKGGAQTLSQGTTDKLQPDMSILVGDELYMSARGPKPVSAVKASNFYANAKPGAMMLPFDKATCKPSTASKSAFALPVWERSPEITADVHGIWKVVNAAGNTEVWAVDQAGTGSVQSFEVYSACAATTASTLHADPR